MAQHHDEPTLYVWLCKQMVGNNHQRHDQKEKDVWKIHQLWIIGIIKSDFSTTLKIPFVEQLMAQAENSGLHNDRWGSRSNRTSTYPALQRMMTFEYGCYTKTTIAVFLLDQTLCFDRMHPGVTNVIAQSHGMDPAPCLCHSKTIDVFQHHIRTALGVSSGSYRDSPPHQILGLIQGNAGVAGILALSSSSLFWAHDKIYKGLDLPGIIPSDGIKKNNDGYVNDIDTYAG